MTVFKNVLGRAARLIQATPLTLHVTLHVWPLHHQVKVSHAECDGDGGDLDNDESGNKLKGAKDGNKRMRKRKNNSSAAEMLTFLQSYSEK